MGPLRTDFLFATPSFLSGMARVLDLFGVFDSYNESRSVREADARALYSDWSMVAHDLKNAASQPNDRDDQKQLRLNFSNS